jgi:DNA-binding transcriptional ArsR family regulator
MHVQADKRASAPRADPELPTEAQVEVAVGSFALLADPTRLKIIWLLGEGDHDVNDLARLVGATPAATSQHLAKLRLAGLAKMRRAGRHHVYSAQDSHVRHLIREALHHADHTVAGHPDHP